MKLFLIASLLFAAPQDVAKDKAQDAVKPAAEAVGAEAQAAIVKIQAPSYPLATCVVSGEELGSMGDPIEHVVSGRLVRLCCKGCIKKVDASPASFIAKVDEAVIQAQKADYPLTTCPVSGEPLGDEAVDNVVGTRLVRTCCKRCSAPIAKETGKYLPIVDKAYMDAQRPTYPAKTCPVSGEELGSMGEPVEVLYGTRLVRFCCKSCLKGFDKDPAGVVAKLDAASKGAPKK